MFWNEEGPRKTRSCRLIGPSDLPVEDPTVSRVSQRTPVPDAFFSSLTSEKAPTLSKTQTGRVFRSESKKAPLLDVMPWPRDLDIIFAEEWEGEPVDDIMKFGGSFRIEKEL